jgi:GT2 family glycosyltransferase
VPGGPQRRLSLEDDPAFGLESDARDEKGTRGVQAASQARTREIRSRIGPPPPTEPSPLPEVESVLPPYAAAIVNYQSYEDLERCLAALEAQSEPPARVFVHDADGDPAQRASVSARYPQVRFEAGHNCGYAAAANYLLSRLLAEGEPVDYVLLLNPDVELEPSFCEHLVDAMGRDARVALGGGKLLRPCGRLIDSAGIELPLHRRPRDRGSEQLDVGQYDEAGLVFGVTGAAMMLRVAALPDLQIDGELFDEDFFMYHEDTDLSWRANLLGWRVLYEPRARGVHTRGWRREDRFGVAGSLRRHSFKNHYLQLIKNESLAGFVRGLPVLAGWEVLRLGFALLRDREVLGGYREALRLAGPAFDKRRALQQRIARRHSGAMATRTPAASEL